MEFWVWERTGWVSTRGCNICFRASRRLVPVRLTLHQRKQGGFLFRGRHVARGINKRKWWLNTGLLLPEKSNTIRLKPTNTPACSLAWCSNTHSHIHELILLCWALFFYAGGHRKSIRVIWLLRWRHGVSFQVHGWSPHRIKSLHLHLTISASYAREKQQQQKIEVLYFPQYLTHWIKAHCLIMN